MKNLLRFICFVLTACLLISGCSGKAAKEESVSRQIVSKDGNFFVWQHAGRHYVLGSDASNKKFASTHVIPIAKTHLGAGPAGETVVFELDKKDASYVERLKETYEKTPFLIAGKGDTYFVYKCNGRIYVLGDPATRDKLVNNGSIPYAKTIIGAGPNGETVIYETNNKKDAKMTERLVSMYKN